MEEEEIKEDYLVIIAGSRDFTDYEFLKEKAMKLLANKIGVYNVKIVSGAARGADKMGEQFADEYGLEKVLCPADWDGLGKKAGYIRNEEMAKIADALIAFWDSKSKGTKHMIDLATKYKLSIRIVNY